MKLIIIGPPGSGKGTQGKILSNKLKIEHISVGDLIRSLMLKNNFKNEIEIKKLINEGKLLPDNITNSIVIEYLKKIKQKKGYILDGFPRTIIQAKTFNNFLLLNRNKVDLVIILEVPIEVILNRLLDRVCCYNCGMSFNKINNPPLVSNICDNCGNALIKRKDDLKKIIIERFKIHNINTQPIIDFYEKIEISCKITGDLTVEETTKKILKYLPERYI